MTKDVDLVLKEYNILSYRNCGILMCPVNNKKQGIDLAKDLLYKTTDKKTVLYLSGGTTPGELYRLLSLDEQLNIGASAMIDERFGPKWHERSNEKMIKETGLLRYFELTNVPFYPILQGGVDTNRSHTAKLYDEKLRTLQSTFPKHIGILGLGEDGHTAGIPAKSQSASWRTKLKTQNFNEKFNGTDFVTDYDDGGERYGERVTMTFTALSMLDLMIVLVFGKSKAQALSQVFEDGSEQQTPARFYKRDSVSKKTIIITEALNIK